MGEPSTDNEESPNTRTQDEWYTQRLDRRASRLWKRFLPDPYRWHIRSLQLGYMLDVGCGIGRCLQFNDGNGIGIDHNPSSVERCRSQGFEAYTPSEFEQVSAGPFDSMLLSHVLEHLSAGECEELLRQYLPFVRPGGRVVLITPQIAGQRSDPTHQRYLGRGDLKRELEVLGLTDLRTRSFPFPAPVGRVFTLNENVAWGRIPGGIEF